MQDRIPTYPGRVRLTRVTGDFYDMEMADEPTVQGTSLNKATLLSDETAQKISKLSPDGTAPTTVNEALSLLAGGGTITLKDAYTSMYAMSHSTAPNLNNGRARNTSGASVGNYALFAGGGYYNNVTWLVDAYNTSLTKTIPTHLSESKTDLASASVGNYALFAGGECYNGYLKSVDAYNLSLTRSIVADLSAGRSLLAGASVGNYALFAGGTNAASSNYSIVDAYDTNLTRYIASPLNRGKFSAVGASVGNYALFAGGLYYDDDDSFYITTVDCYTGNLTRSIQSPMPRHPHAGASTGNYALFATSNYENGRESVLEYYDSRLTNGNISDSVSAYRFMIGVGFGDFALFAGGRSGTANYVYVSSANAINSNLTKIALPALQLARAFMGGATVGNFVLFAGGYYSGSDASGTNIVDAYEYAPHYYMDLHIPEFSKYYIDGITSEETFTLSGADVSAESSVPFNGYIKRGGFTLTGLIS